MPKLFWTKISSLATTVLEKQGEEVSVFYEEKKQTKKKQKDKRFFSRKKRKEIPQEEWLPDHSQGQLVVDIYEDEKNNNLVIESTIAGIKSKDIDITVEPDLIIIRGQREKKDKSESRRYYYQECFWGKFSRTLVLPCRILPDAVKANIRSGILTIILPRAQQEDGNVEIKE